MLNRPVLLLTATVAIIGSNSLVLSPIAGAVAASFAGVEPAGVMIASAIYGLGTAVSALILAPRADRIGAERVLLWAVTAVIVGLLASAIAPALWVLCAAQGIAGLAAGAALPAAYGLSPQVAPKGCESETLGIVLTGWTLSMVAGVSLSALLADFLHWRAVFVSLAAVAMVVAILLSRTRDWGQRAPAAAETSPLTALRVPGITGALIVCAAYMTAFYGLYSYLGVHVQDRLGHSTAMAGLATLAYGVGFGIAVPLDRLIDRYGARRMAMPVFAGLLLTYAALAATTSSLTGLVTLCLIWGLANHLGLNLIIGRLAALDPGQRGAIMGLYSAVTYVCVFMGAVAYRPIYDQAGLTACAALSALLILLAIGDAILSRRPQTEGAG